MRATLAEALKTAQKAQDRTAVATLRLINAAIQDRDIANRGAAKPPLGDDDIVSVLSKMVKQREESARIYDDAGRAELATQERAEIAIIKRFLPQQMDEAEMRRACAAVIEEIGAEGLRDIGRCMAVLKERYAGRMDFAKASGIVKELLQ